MTYPYNKQIYRPKRKGLLTTFVGQDCIDEKKMAVVIPVKDNQKGIEVLLNSFFKELQPSTEMNILIVVDNNSTQKVYIPDEIIYQAQKKDVQIVLLEEKKVGPAAARNTGWRLARHLGSEWVLFVDSDCQFLSSTISDYTQSLNGSIAYQGKIIVKGKDFLSRFYSAEKILTPLVFREAEEDFFRPNYLVTANALVNIGALVAVDGFNEDFQQAGGEDIDLAYRLLHHGKLSFASYYNPNNNQSMMAGAVLHDYLDGELKPQNKHLCDLYSRFYRYGKGNRQLEKLHHIDRKSQLTHTTLNEEVNKLFNEDPNQIVSEEYWTHQKLLDLAKYALSHGYHDSDL